MFQTVLNSTEGRPLGGNLRYCVSDGVDCVGSCNTSVVDVLSILLANDINILDTEVLGVHGLDADTNLVVHVGVSAYMKVETQGLLNLCLSLVYGV